MDDELEALLKSGKVSNDAYYDSDSMSSDCVELKSMKCEDAIRDNVDTSQYVDSSEPYVGRTFQSLEEAEKFYRDYAKKAGFEVRIKSRRKSKKLGDWSCCLFQCKKAGKCMSSDGSGPSNATKATKGQRKRDILVPTDCKAKMYVSFNKEGKHWTIVSYESHHNHEMVSPTKQNFMPSYRNVPQSAREMIDVFRRTNIGPSKMHQFFQTQAGGIDAVGFGVKDIENVVRDQRRAEWSASDAQAAIEYLKKAKEDTDGQLFYRGLYTTENRLKSLVWVDGRSRAAYKLFGDVVTFDTTYRTNKYDMPFAPFTGVNHHYHSILFGYALLGDEKEETFEWVLSTWLEAMDGIAPQTIITDQCQQIGDAIRKVLPNTHHGLCTWHISSKYPDKLNQVYKHHPSFKADYDRCVSKSLSSEEFEEKWRLLMDKYGLQGNEWLSGLYKVREQWIPAYTKSHFAAGMTTTARSEGMNHFFDQYVSSCTSLKDFVHKSVVNALEKQFFRERKDDFDSKYYSRKLECRSALEQHAARVYTKAMFKRFQSELGKSSQFNFRKESDSSTNDNLKVYLCRNDLTGRGRDKRVFTIRVRKDTAEMNCNCQLFEHLGILCRHLLRYLSIKNCSEIPTKYILERWTKDANKSYAHDLDRKRPEVVDISGSQTMRYNHMVQLLLGVAQKASCSVDAYKYVIDWVERGAEVIDAFPLVNDVGMPVESTQEEAIVDADDDQIETDVDPVDVLDPTIVARKGRKREKRLKRPIELIKKQKPLRLCSLCKTYTNHDKRNCDKKKKN